MGKREGSPVRGREGLNSLGSVDELLVSFSVVEGAGVLLSDVDGVLLVFGFLVR